MFSIRALVCVWCHPVYTAIGFFKTAGASAGSWLWPINTHSHHYSSSCAAKVSTLEFELKRFSQNVLRAEKVHSSCSADADAIKLEFLTETPAEWSETSHTRHGRFSVKGSCSVYLLVGDQSYCVKTWYETDRCEQFVFVITQQTRAAKTHTQDKIDSHATSSAEFFAFQSLIWMLIFIQVNTRRMNSWKQRGECWCDWSLQTSAFPVGQFSCSSGLNLTSLKRGQPFVAIMCRG